MSYSTVAIGRLAVKGFAIAVSLTFVGLLAYGVIARAPSRTIDNSLSKGRSVAAPPFHLAVLQRGALGSALSSKLGSAYPRQTLTLSDLRGTPVVLNIWASWCTPCQQEAATLERAWRGQGRPRGVLFVGLDMQDVTSDAQAFMHHYGIDYATIRDPGTDVPHAYGATGVPETFFISAQGRIVGHVIGVADSQQLNQGITAALSGQVENALQGGAQDALQ